MFTGKFSRFFLSAILLPFAPAAFGGIKNIIYGDDPDADKKIGKFVSDMMKNEKWVMPARMTRSDGSYEFDPR